MIIIKSVSPNWNTKVYCFYLILSNIISVQDWLQSSYGQFSATLVFALSRSVVNFGSFSLPKVRLIFYLSQSSFTRTLVNCLKVTVLPKVDDGRLSGFSQRLG